MKHNFIIIFTTTTATNKAFSDETDRNSVPGTFAAIIISSAN